MTKLLNIRVKALLRTLFIVAPLLFITSRSVTVKAVSEMVSETAYLSGMQISYGDTYTVHVPCDNIRFMLPELPSTEPSSETVEIYTNEDKSAWSLTETDELKTKYSATKTCTVSYEWTGDVSSEGDSFFVTSSETGTKTAVIKKNETVEYIRPENNTVIEGLGSSSSSNHNTFIIQTDVPEIVTINSGTGRVIDKDGLRTDNTTEFYYGEPRYEVKVKEGEKDKTIGTFDYEGIDNYISGGPDETYYVTKYMIGEYSSSNIALYKANEQSLVKNAVVIITNSIKEIDGTAEQSKEYDGSLSITGVNPNHRVKVSFVTDDEHCTFVANPALSIVGNGCNYQFAIDGDISKNNRTDEYIVKVTDHLGLRKDINVKIAYGDGTPVITGDSLSGANEVEGVNYVNSELEALTVRANASAPNSPIASGKVGISTSSDMTGETLSDASIIGERIIAIEYTLSDLTEGNNYFRVCATSGYGIESKSNTILNVVLDSKKPTISNLVLKQDGKSIADGTGITCMKDAEISFDITDENPSSGIDSVEVKRAKAGGEYQPVSEISEISGGKATLKISADDNNSGNTYTYKFIAYDKAGNKSSEVEKEVTFDNDMSLKVTRKITPAVVNDFPVWTDSTKVAVIEYEVISDVEIDEFATISLDGDDVSDSSAFEKTDKKHYKYTLNYSLSKTVKNIVLTVKNKNGHAVTDTLDVLHIDVADPKFVGTESDSKWQKSFVLTGSVSDPQDGDSDAVSGLSSAKYTITNSTKDASQTIDVSSGTGNVSISVPESKTTDGTKIRFDLADKVNNSYSNTYTYYIDNTPPTAELSVSGKDVSGLGEYFLKNDPVIKYSGSDALSGLAETDGIVFRINGTEYKRVSGKKLSEIIGGIGNTTEYIVELIVTDKVGNSSIQKTAFTVDIPKAKVSGTLLAKMTAKGRNSLVLTWSRVEGADGYDIFFIKCNKKAPKKIKTVKAGKTLKWTKTGLKKGKPYKAYIKAFVVKKGKKTYVKKSPSIHVYTAGGTKHYTNVRSVTVKKPSVSLRAGKTYKIKANVIKLQKDKELMPEGHAPKLRYISSNKKIARVSKTGKITAKAKGSCKVYVIAVNGVRKAVKVTVN